MTKYKKQNKVLAIFVGIILAIAIVLTGALAGGVINASATADVGSAVNMSFVVPTRVSYMDTLSYSDFGLTGSETVRIRAPDGQREEIDVGESFRFTQVGIYNLEFTDGTRVVHSTTIRAELDAELRLRVEDGGARIPTVINATGEFILPYAHLYYRTPSMDDFERFSNDNSLDSNLRATIRVETTTRVAGTVQDITNRIGQTHSYADVGFYTIRYSARLDVVTQAAVGNTEEVTMPGTSWVVENFGVRVQSASFTHTEAPTLTVVPPPTSMSINTRVTLPTATATDIHDENVLVEVTVLDPNGEPVEIARVNERTGFAHGTTGEPVRFDNRYTMYFYPTMTGRYTVSYVAENDFGIRSSELDVHFMNSEDRSAPTLLNIDDFQIPTTWGRNVLRRNPADENRPTLLTGDEMNILFPVPEFVDNGARYEDGEWNDNMQRVSFEIRDTITNNIVIRFENILDQEGDGSSFTFDPNRTATQGFYQPPNNATVRFRLEPETVNGTTYPAGFSFNFDNYINNTTILQDNPGFDGLGRYTVQFLARDNANISTTRTYDITLVSELMDVTDPTINVNFDNHIYIHQGLEFITVPNAVLSDTQTDRPTIEFTLTPVDGTDEAAVIVGGDDNFLEVSANERLEVIYREARVFLRNADARFYAPGEVDANAGIYASKEIDITDALALRFDIRVTDSVGNYRQEDNEDRIVPLVLDLNLTGAVTLDTSNINTTSDILLESGLYNLGGFTITGVTPEQRNFIGFEISVIDGEGEAYTIDSLYSFYNTVTSTITVQDIRVDLLSGEYYLNIRAFNIAGTSSAATFVIEVDRPTVGGGGTTPSPASIRQLSTSSSSGPIGALGRINERYTLRNARGLIIPDGSPMVREIRNATHFSLMGSEFSAHSQGAVTFAEGWLDASAGGVFRAIQTPYSVSFDEAADFQFSIQGSMPVHAPETRPGTAAEWIELPMVVASNASSQATVEPVVRGPDGTDELRLGSYTGTEGGGAALQRMSDDPENPLYNRFRFRANRAGNWTVQFHATIGNADGFSDTHTMRVGNVVALPIALVGTQNVPVLNGNFLFNEVTYVEEMLEYMGDRIDDIAFTKRLLLAGNVVFETSERGRDGARRTTNDQVGEDGFLITAVGEYTVEYITEDSTGLNRYVLIHSFTIQGEGAPTPWPLRVLSTVLVILAVLLIAGIVLYVVRFRRLKVKKEKQAAAAADKN